MGGKGNKGSDQDWVCRSAGGGVCSTTKTAFTNFGHRRSCFKCGKSKGKCNAGPVQGGPPSRSRNEQTELWKVKKELAEARKKLKEKPGDTAGNGAGGAPEEEEDPESAEKAEITQKLQRTRRRLNQYKGIAEGEREAADLEAIKACDDEIKDLLARQIAGKPLDERTRNIEGKLERTRRNIVAEQAKLEMHRKSLAEIQEKLDAAAANIVKHEASKAELEGELKEVHSRLAGGLSIAVPVPPESVSFLKDLQVSGKMGSMFRKEMDESMAVLCEGLFKAFTAGSSSPDFPPQGRVDSPGEPPPEVRPQPKDEDEDFDMQWNSFVEAGLDKGEEGAKEKYIEAAKKRKKAAV